MEKNEKRLILVSEEDFETDDEAADSVTAPDGGKKNNKKASEEDKPGWKVFLEYVRVIAIGALIAFLLSKFVIINAVVPTGSMIPTIQKKDRLIGFRLSYTFDSPERGDVAIFVTPDPDAAEGELYIKRVIGLPGETLVINGSTITITKQDGSTLILTPETEPYINQILYSQGYLDLDMNHQTIYLHYEGELDENGELALDEDGNPYQNQYFMMGDNRDASNDSRSWGPVNEDAILAKAIFKYFKGISGITKAVYEE